MHFRHPFGFSLTYQQLVHLILGRAVLALALIAGCTMFATSASASCGVSAADKSVRFPRSPIVDAQALWQQSSQSIAVDDASIVGLWDVRFLHPDGELIDEGFDQFHSDGLEILSDNGPPQPANGSGTVCLGVYKKEKLATHVIYKVRHPFWIVDELGNLSGTGVVLETIVLNNNNASFEGSYTAVSYDMDGNESSRDEGLLKAKRITAD